MTMTITVQHRYITVPVDVLTCFWCRPTWRVF